MRSGFNPGPAAKEESSQPSGEEGIHAGRNHLSKEKEDSCMPTQARWTERESWTDW